MGYIKKKEGNLLIPRALSNGHWQTKNSQDAGFSQADAGNVVPLPHLDSSPLPENQKEMWRGYGAVASVLVVFCGLFIVQKNVTGRQTSRDLAANNPLIVPDEQKNMDNIIADLNSGRRTLASIHQGSLEEKEHFEHRVLNSYYVSFNSDDVLSEVQLRPEKSPIYIKNHMEFIKNHRDFFPSYSQIQKADESFDQDENLKTSGYLLTGALGTLNVSFKTDEQGMLISIFVENP